MEVLVGFERYLVKRRYIVKNTSPEEVLVGQIYRQLRFGWLDIQKVEVEEYSPEEVLVGKI